MPATVGLYGNFRGGERLRKAIAQMMQRTFMGVEVGALLLFFCRCELKWNLYLSSINAFRLKSLPRRREFIMLSVKLGIHTCPRTD